MFDEVNSNKTVVNGSVIWLYCKVNSLSSLLSLSWNKGGVQLVQNAPHVRIRNSTTSSYTVLVLVIDNVLTSDEGVYYCTAKNEGTITTGISLNLTGISIKICVVFKALHDNNIQFSPQMRLELSK